MMEKPVFSVLAESELNLYGPGGHLRNKCWQLQVNRRLWR